MTASGRCNPALTIPPSLAILIPCYNCGEALIQVVESSRQFTDQILLINDGSTDDTASCIEQSGCETIGWEPNRGKGAALREGFQYLLQKDTWETVMTLDSDGQHNPLEIPAFLSAYQKYKCGYCSRNSKLRERNHARSPLLVEHAEYQAHFPSYRLQNARFSMRLPAVFPQRYTVHASDADIRCLFHRNGNGSFGAPAEDFHGGSECRNHLQ